MIHYYMAVKRDIREPLVYALIFAFLFWLRLKKPAARTSSRRDS
jgi:DMSO/TMAO reductase YedYZ heme-binding membrane subunit